MRSEVEMASQQSFTFVNLSAPQDTKTKGNKKRIRSAAATSGWAQGGHPKNPQPPRDFHSLDLQSSHVGQRQINPHTDLDSKREQKGPGASEAENIAEHSGYSDFVWEKSHPQNSPLAEQCVAVHPDLRLNKPNTTRKWTSRVTLPFSTTRKKAPRSFSTASTSSQSTVVSPSTVIISWISSIQSPGTDLTSPTPSLFSPHDLGSGNRDAFNCYPVDSQPWFDRVLHHMLTVFAPRGWPALGISNAEGLMWERFMTQHALEEPALFNVRLLFASGDLIRMKALSPGTALWLRDQAIRSINEALNDSVRAISDPLILAVGRIALHECMYGDRGAANFIHRPAQHKMIMMRGGMGALDFPELVKRLMRWADRVMSMQSDTPRLLPDDDASFSIGQSVDVLEKWVPQEGLSLRQKVKTEE